MVQVVGETVGLSCARPFSPLTESGSGGGEGVVVLDLHGNGSMYEFRLTHYSRQEMVGSISSAPGRGTGGGSTTWEPREEVIFVLYCTLKMTDLTLKTLNKILLYAEND